MPERGPQSVRDFLPQVPESLLLSTGEYEFISESWVTFFDEVMNYLGLTQEGREKFPEIKNLVFSLSTDRNREVEDEGMFLLVADLPVASITTIKNQGNYVQALFAHYLTPGWETKVRQRIYNPSGGEHDIRYLAGSLDHFS